MIWTKTSHTSAPNLIPNPPKSCHLPTMPSVSHFLSIVRPTCHSDFPHPVSLNLTCPSTISSDTTPFREPSLNPPREEGGHEDPVPGALTAPSVYLLPSSSHMMLSLLIHIHDSLISCEQMEDSCVFHLVCNRCLAYVCCMNKWPFHSCASLLELEHEAWQ